MQWAPWVAIGIMLLGQLVALVVFGVKLSGKVDGVKETQVGTTKAVEIGAAANVRVLEIVAKQDSRLAVLEQRVTTSESDIREVRLTARDAAARHPSEDRKRD